jgi:hypothetical protein
MRCWQEVFRAATLEQQADMPQHRTAEHRTRARVRLTFHHCLTASTSASNVFASVSALKPMAAAALWSSEEGMLGGWWVG